MDRNVEIIAKMEALLLELKSSLGGNAPKIKRATKEKNAGQEFSGLTGEIFDLVQDGFFKEPRTISEIQKKLRLEGVNKPTTSLMKPLLLLIRKKIIGRNEAADGKGPFRYRQR
ncbi:MAG: hypothetical protein AAB402_02365 [Patescibacteria group bacterium]